MLINPRPLNLKFKARGQEKTRLVLTWLLEWRVSSLELLSARIGLKSTASTRFFKKLLARNILERIKVNHCDKRDLVILGPEGHKILGTSNIAYAAELNRVRKYTKKRTVTHDLEAQKAVLKLMPGALEVVSEFNVKLNITGKKPDALVFRWNRKTEKLFAVAVEMEKSPKDSVALYIMLHKYLELMKKGELTEVRFYFSNADDMKMYLTYYDRELWPYTGQKKVGDKMVPTTFFTSVAKDHWCRERFFFEVLVPEEAPTIFPLEKAARLERVFKHPYLERLKLLEQEPIINQLLQEQEKRKKEKEEAERLALQKELNERKAVQERIGKRREKTASLYEALAKAKAEDNSLKAWKPGYVFQTQPVLEQIIVHLTEHLEREERQTLHAYEIE